jgi:ribose transport system ATP-binding protein
LTAPVLSIEDLHKSYAVPVLQGAHLEVAPGEVLALVGANGAGKSTLCNIVGGVTQPGSGRMLIDGTPHAPASIRDAELAGVQFVMQELNLIDSLSIAENLFLGELPSHRGFIDFDSLNEQASSALADIGLDSLDPRQAVSSLGVGQKQLLEIARALTKPCRLLILDEPTAALTDPQIDTLFEKISAMRSDGTALIYVSHRMHEIRQIADQVSILRDGKTVRTSPVSEIDTETIVKTMAGEIRVTHGTSDLNKSSSTALRIRGLSTKSLLDDVDLDIRYGEILGLAGLVGSGRTELLRAVFAADKIERGAVFLEDGNVPSNLRGPRDAVKSGIGLIPEDRKQQGLLLEHSVRSNATLPALDRYASALGFINSDMEERDVSRMCDTLSIGCNDQHQPVRELSGGNQQKVSIARWLLRDCRVLLFDEPTRGIDIHAKASVYKLLDDLASDGRAIVVVSSESRELAAISDRIAVMSAGRLVQCFEKGEWTSEKIMSASFSGYVGNDAA